MIFDDLRGKTALVTGASSGLGAYFAGVLAAHGVKVILAARRTEALDTIAAMIHSSGGTASIASLDVRDVEACSRSIAAIGSLDILVNNAGVVHEGSALDGQTETDWDDVVDTNLKGMFFVAQSVASLMKDCGGGSIINVASILGLRQAGGVLPYAVSKAGVIQLTKCLALELARHGIRVNSLAPGYLYTELNKDFWQSEPGLALVRRIPQRRLGQLDDLQGPLLLLASEASRYMTGTEVVVEGGHLVGTL
ncbi:Gluconate 5-dehydrogenase [Variovorax sp. PBS-H4]|uniref:SDR family NAD(P)-dependent oxidoreductase n=1 Tax=Variovorax sp. PBS-H4 TaxID=434008 RepID=UPI001316B8D2|nr:SDR family NAD(P)-dependent oxidoreductase [Variovorax sp. PBS-H4]VTU28064.1 Gluconate 5-dehydrogenase [Variovorax sp. PBS-H4]